MLSRLLPILSLLVVAFVGYLFYSNGVLSRIFEPQVTVPVAERNLSQGQAFTSSTIGTRQVAVADLSAGALSFAPETGLADIVDTLDGMVVSGAIREGEMIKADAIGRTAGLVGLFALDEIPQGETLSLSNVTASAITGDVPSGAVVFATEQSAFEYISQSYDLVAGRGISPDGAIRISDISGSGSDIFVVRAVDTVSRGSGLGSASFEIMSVSPSDVPAGAVAFATRADADAFLDESRSYAVGREMSDGDILRVAQMARSDAGTARETMPTTPGELASYRDRFPDRVLVLRDRAMLGNAADAGGLVAIWIQTGATDGAFASVTIDRVVDAIEVRTIRAPENSVGTAFSGVDTSASGPQPTVGDTTGTEGVEGGEDQAIRALHWLEMDPDIKQRLDAAIAENRIVFAAPIGADLTRVIGNGTGCLAGTCRVALGAAGDLSGLRDAVSGPDPEMTPEVASLMALDGVGADLAASLVDDGYPDIASLAGMSDEEVSRISLQFDVSEDFTRYVREQARILGGSKTRAIDQLGLEAAPNP